MIRNMEMIRAIVLAVRDHEGRPSASAVQTMIRDVDNGDFGYHIALLTQGEMMTGVDTSQRKDRYGVASLALTWEGQNFADNILNDEVWASACKTLEDADLKSASFQVWSQIAIAKISERLSGSEGDR